MREAGRFLLTVVMLIFVGGVALIFLLLTALANVAYSRSQVQAEKDTDQLSFGERSRWAESPVEEEKVLFEGPIPAA